MSIIISFLLVNTSEQSNVNHNNFLLVNISEQSNVNHNKKFLLVKSIEQGRITPLH